MAAALWPATSRAQSLDYGGLQALFGEPVTTSATGTPQRARDVPVDMEIVTADDIRRSGAVDIPGVLSHVAGVDVLRWTNLGADVSVRGYDSPFTPRLLVLIDGRQVYIDIYGLTEWAALPVELSEIRQIEIVKGPTSALFGFNAAGGVINIITYNPLYDRVNTASVKFGTQAYRDGSAVATARIGADAAVRLSAGGTLTNDFNGARAFAASKGLPQRAERSHIGADAHWRITPGSELELEATHAADQRLAETPVWLPGVVFTETSSVRARYTADTAAGVITASAYTNWSNMHADLTGNPATSYDNVLTVATLQDVFQPAADHTVRLSTEYRHSEINTAPIGGGHVYYNIGALSGMWNWNVTPTLSLTAATRVDALWLGRDGAPLPGSGLTNALWDRRIVEPSYNLGAVWRPDDQDSLRLTVSRGVQLPSLIELGGVQALSPYFGVDGNPAMRTSVTNNYELGWDRKLPAVDAESRIAVFYQTTDNIQSFLAALNVSPTPAGYLLALTDNVGNSQEIGAEFALKGTFAEAWRWNLSYTPLLVRDSFLPGASTANTAIDFQHTTPRHVVNASLGWSGGDWEADGFLRFQSSSAGLFRSPNVTYSLVPIGPTVSFDARIGYRIGDHVTLALSGQNVLFSSARQTVFGKVQQRVIGSLTVGF